MTPEPLCRANNGWAAHTPTEAYRDHFDWIVDSIERRSQWQRSDIEDAAQVVFERMLKQWSRLDANGVRNYWWRSTWRQLVAVTRSAYRRHAVFIEPRPDEVDPLDRLGVHHDPEPADLPGLMRLLDGLSMRQAQCLLLSALGYSYQEIADRLGIEYGSVNGHLARARHKMRPHELAKPR